MTLRTPSPVPPEKLARRARIFTVFTAPVFAAMAFVLMVFGLGNPTLLYAGLTLSALTVLLVIAAFVRSRAVRWTAFVIALVGAAVTVVSGFVTIPNDSGVAMTLLLGILPILALALFVLHNVARAAHAARA